jgi:osmotically-inducible protein OsmY
MKTDSQLQHDVMDELEYQPSVDSSHIGVTARDGVVTLTGSTSKYAEKFEAERLAKSIAGVRAVANDIEVRLPGESKRNDTELATAAINALKWHSSIPDGAVQLTVRDGWITLEGKLDWQYQRQTARDAVSCLTGVKGVANNITITEKPQATDIQKKIEAAFKRKAELDAGHVRVLTNKGHVTLNGYVDSWAEYYDAEAVAGRLLGLLWSTTRSQSARATYSRRMWRSRWTVLRYPRFCSWRHW